MKQGTKLIAQQNEQKYIGIIKALKRQIYTQRLEVRNLRKELLIDSHERFITLILNINLCKRCRKLIKEKLNEIEKEANLI